METAMLTKQTFGRVLIALVLFSAAFVTPREASAADDAAARAAAASDPQYSSWAAMRKMKAMDAMHMIDSDKKGYVTKEEFMKFQEQFFEHMDRDHDGKVTAKEWMGTGAARKEK
jgi:EF hand